MSPRREIDTARLRLRRWLPSDRVPFAALNADPLVMEHFPSVLSPDESDALADRIDTHFERHGFGLWAVQIRGSAPFAGFVGLAVPSFETSFTPCVEVGWRLAREHWGRGFATEGAQAAVELAARDLGLREVVSYTVPANRRSRRVMEKLGMTNDPADDFDHPELPVEHPLRRHVLYRLTLAPPR